MQASGFTYFMLPMGGHILRFCRISADEVASQSWQDGMRRGGSVTVASVVHMTEGSVPFLGEPESIAMDEMTPVEELRSIAALEKKWQEAFTNPCVVERWRKSDTQAQSDREAAKPMAITAIALLEEARREQKLCTWPSHEMDLATEKTLLALLQLSEANLLSLPYTEGAEFQARRTIADAYRRDLELHRAESPALQLSDARRTMEAARP